MIREKTTKTKKHTRREKKRGEAIEESSKAKHSKKGGGVGDVEVDSECAAAART
jgi:hypothetical protein